MLIPNEILSILSAITYLTMISLSDNIVEYFK